VICANACYQQVRNMKALIMGEPARGRSLGTDLAHPCNDFCKIAAGMGLEAHRVEQPADLAPTLRRAFAVDAPNLVEVRMDSA
jgi:thiamine pyrophosphate-dependent acetolactate synthase large subunit-like protein